MQEMYCQDKRYERERTAITNDPVIIMVLGTIVIFHSVIPVRRHASQQPITDKLSSLAIVYLLGCNGSKAKGRHFETHTNKPNVAYIQILTYEPFLCLFIISSFQHIVLKFFSIKCFVSVSLFGTY